MQDYGFRSDVQGLYENLGVSRETWGLCIRFMSGIIMRIEGTRKFCIHGVVLLELFASCKSWRFGALMALETW